MLRWVTLAAITSIASLAASCSQDIPPRDPRNLDRPSAIAFGCFGDRQLDNGDIVRSALPLSECVESTAGTGGAPDMYGFVLQTAKGTAALVNLTVNTVIDSDPFVPGRNSIPIGTLPIALATDPDGCQITVANAGTCDLSIVDVTRAISQDPSVTRVALTNAGGVPFAGVPSDLVGLPPAEESAASCPTAPQHPVYIAYPDCNLVAAIDPASGAILAGIDYSSGAPVITDGNVTCDATCPGKLVQSLGVVDGQPPRPAALRVARASGSRLYVGAENSPLVSIVNLGADGLPTAVNTVELEGDVGVTAMADTGPITMGGSTGTFGAGSAGQFSFLYAVATDRTVRVVEVDTRVECDTQIDPRYLLNVTNPTLFACFEVGDPDNPPRRARARGPGIPMPRDAVPLDVEVFEATDPIQGQPQYAPGRMVGYFALVTASDGFAHVINIDDDYYPDFENQNDPGEVYLTLALPHQIRDAGSSRNEIPPTCEVTSNALLPGGQFGPRAAAGFVRFLDNRFIASERLHLLPQARSVLCSVTSSEGVVSVAGVSELDLGAPAPIREQALPDLSTVLSEDWRMTWEGTLSLDVRATNIDGPPVRVGVIARDGSDVVLRDAAEPFCEMGVQDHDIVDLLGCQVTSQCSVGEDCIFHPDTPARVDSGLCAPEAAADAVLSQCRDILVTHKQYTVTDTQVGRLALRERRRILQTTPTDGCVSNDECALLAEEEIALTSSEHPVDANPPEPFDYVCEADPSRKPGLDHCVRTCETDLDCRDSPADPDDQTTHGDGWVCKQNRCVSGVLPTEQCMRTLQRYGVRAGEAFTVIGVPSQSTRATGFLHGRIVDPAPESNQCIDDPNANPLLTGRIPLRGVPACEGDGATDLTPNPCLTTVDHYDEYEPFDDQCNPSDAPAESRQVEAIRFRNPVLTMHLVNPWTSGDAMCLQDGEGALPRFSPVYQGFSLRAQFLGGSTPFFAPINIPPQSDVAFPAEVERGPDGRLWVLDKGDVTSGVLTQGRVLEVVYSLEQLGFAIDTIL